MPRIDIKTELVYAVDYVLTRMAQEDRFSDDEKVIGGADLQPSDAVIAKRGEITFYGAYLDTGIAYGAMVGADDVPKFTSWTVYACRFDDMPMRTIFETEGRAWREAVEAVHDAG